MRFVTSSPSEFQLVGRRGRIVTRGTAASAFVWPGSTWVTVSAKRQEARFETTQETRDGIPLRFEGIVVHRVVDPVAAATPYGKELEALAPLSAALELLVARLRPVLAAPGDGGYRPAPEPPAAQGCLTGGGSR
ncbi:MAG: hypothetical protein HY906_07195 [Deltaproteobacteria bacterium]|nr:hypothetical protein [Deltaproteobacteria bacterium]